jgi:hypothetical protein
MAEDRLKPVLLQRLVSSSASMPLGPIRTRTNATVVGHPHALDEPALGHPVHDPRGVAERDVEELGEPAHREVP